jgi:hypothetical protein
MCITRWNSCTKLGVAMFSEAATAVVPAAGLTGNALHRDNTPAHSPYIYAPIITEREAHSAENKRLVCRSQACTSYFAMVHTN